MARVPIRGRQEPEPVSIWVLAGEEGPFVLDRTDPPELRSHFAWGPRVCSNSEAAGAEVESGCPPEGGRLAMQAAAGVSPTP